MRTQGSSLRCKGPLSMVVETMPIMTRSLSVRTPRLTQYALTSIFNKVLDLVSLQPVVSQPDVKDSIAILRLEIED